jgi:hypothetical protein
MDVIIKQIYFSLEHCKIEKINLKFHINFSLFVVIT